MIPQLSVAKTGCASQGERRRQQLSCSVSAAAALRATGARGVPIRNAGRCSAVGSTAWGGAHSVSHVPPNAVKPSPACTCIVTQARVDNDTLVRLTTTGPSRDRHVLAKVEKVSTQSGCAHDPTAFIPLQCAGDMKPRVIKPIQMHSWSLADDEEAEVGESSPGEEQPAP